MEHPYCHTHQQLVEYRTEPCDYGTDPTCRVEVVDVHLSCPGGVSRTIKPPTPATVEEARSALSLYDEDGFIDNNDQQRAMPLVRWALAALGEVSDD